MGGRLLGPNQSQQTATQRLCRLRKLILPKLDLFRAQCFLYSPPKKHHDNLSQGAAFIFFPISNKLQNPEVCAPTSQRSFSSLRPYISILYPWREEEYEGHKGILVSDCKSSMSTREIAFLNENCAYWNTFRLWETFHKVPFSNWYKYHCFLYSFLL